MIHHETANRSFYIGKVKFLTFEQRSYSKSNVNRLLNLSARGASIGQMIEQYNQPEYFPKRAIFSKVREYNRDCTGYSFCLLIETIFMRRFYQA